MLLPHPWVLIDQEPAASRETLGINARSLEKDHDLVCESTKESGLKVVSKSADRCLFH